MLKKKSLWNIPFGIVWLTLIVSPKLICTCVGVVVVTSKLPLNISTSIIVPSISTCILLVLENVTPLTVKSQSNLLVTLASKVWLPISAPSFLSITEYSDWLMSNVFTNPLNLTLIFVVIVVPLVYVKSSTLASGTKLPDVIMLYLTKGVVVKFISLLIATALKLVLFKAVIVVWLCGIISLLNKGVSKNEQSNV